VNIKETKLNIIYWAYCKHVINKLSTFQNFRYNDETLDSKSLSWTATSYEVISYLAYNTLYTIGITAHGCNNSVTTDSVQMKTDELKQGEMHFDDNGNFTKEKLGKHICLL